MKKQPKKAPKPTRPEADYQSLDDAIAVILSWQSEIIDELARRALNASNYHNTMDALKAVHSPEE